MKSSISILLFSLVLGWQPCWGQVDSASDTVLFEKVVFLGGSPISHRKSDSTEVGVDYSFKEMNGETISILQYGNHYKDLVIILGVCCCMGDTVSLMLEKLEPGTGRGNQDSSMRRWDWVPGWGSIGKNGLFVPKKSFRKSFLKRVSWPSIVVVYGNRLYLIQVLGAKRYHSSHGDFGDRCESCTDGTGI